MVGTEPRTDLTVVNEFLRQYDAEENATAIVALLDTRRRTLVFGKRWAPPPLVLDRSAPYFWSFRKRICRSE